MPRDEFGVTIEEGMRVAFQLGTASVTGVVTEIEEGSIMGTKELPPAAIKPEPTRIEDGVVKFPGGLIFDPVEFRQFQKDHPEYSHCKENSRPPSYTVKKHKMVDRLDKSLAECVADNSKNEEGYVLRWTNRMRIKVKLPEYIRLRKLITGISPKYIWEMLKTGQNCHELLRDVPKEFEDWVLRWEQKIATDKESVMNLALAIMIAYPGEKHVATKEQRKDFSLYATQHKEFSAILFALLDSDHERAEDVAWKMARPKRGVYVTQAQPEPDIPPAIQTPGSAITQ
jgi:hypothetical protein